MKDMRAIAIMNNKGGVGKTVTAINLADILVREYGKRVVLVDCDGQANLTRFYLPEFDGAAQTTTSDVLLGASEPVWSDNLLPLSDGLDLLPADSSLYELDRRVIQDGIGTPERLVWFIRAARDDADTDFVIFDCPPGFTLASVGALMAADEVVIPMMMDGFGFSGMADLTQQVASLRRTQHRLNIAGILVTQWHNSPVVTQGEALLRQMRVPVFETVIRRTDKVAESTMDRTPVTQYSRHSAAARDYRSWAAEYLGEVLQNGV